MATRREPEAGFRGRVPVWWQLQETTLASKSTELCARDKSPSGRVSIIYEMRPFDVVCHCAGGPATGTSLLPRGPRGRARPANAVPRGACWPLALPRLRAARWRLRARSVTPASSLSSWASGLSHSACCPPGPCVTAHVPVPFLVRPGLHALLSLRLLTDSWVESPGPGSPTPAPIVRQRPLQASPHQDGVHARRGWPA